MVARVQLSAQERGIIETVIREGWRVKLDNWTIARIALARSLQMSEAPKKADYPILAKQTGGVELHSPQLTGEGRAGEVEDFTDVYRAMLSVYEASNLFDDEDAFHEALQRHVRRGLKALSDEWDAKSDLNLYLLEELLPPPSRDATDAAGQPAERVAKALSEIGVGAKLVSTQIGPRVTRFIFELAQLEDLDRLRRGEAKIAFALGLGDHPVGIALGSSERTVLLDIPRPPASWRTVEWSTARLALGGPASQGMELPVCLGEDVLGAPMLVDLSEAPHLFVGGTTGSGKSMCLHSIILSLLEAKTAAPDLLLVDPKSVEFSPYSGMKNLFGGQVVTTADDAVLALEQLVLEMERRQPILGKHGARDIAEANAKGAGLKRIVAVVDELGDLIMTREDIEIPLIRLAQKARSSGIHLVLATQRPEAATFPGMLRTNVPSRIALTVQKSSESRIILDESGAEDLLGRGDMLVRMTGKQIARAHGSRVTPIDIERGVAGK